MKGSAINRQWCGTSVCVFFHILGINKSQLTNSYLSEQWLNHQPHMDIEAVKFGPSLGPSPNAPRHLRFSNGDPLSPGECDDKIRIGSSKLWHLKVVWSCSCWGILYNSNIQKKKGALTAKFFTSFIHHEWGFLMISLSPLENSPIDDWVHRWFRPSADEPEFNPFKTDACPARGFDVGRTISIGLWVGTTALRYRRFDKWAQRIIKKHLTRYTGW